MIALAIFRRTNFGRFRALKNAVLRNERSGIGVARLLIVMLLFCAGIKPVIGGSILREVWTDVAGGSVSDLTNDPRYPNQPTTTNYVTDLFESPSNVLDNYGQRMHGYVIPPVTGNYTFWIASDDGGQLWLSTDDNPANSQLISSVAGWTSAREWTKEPNQQSAPIRLEAGKPYYISALQKEGGGGDNLAVRWLRPDGADEGPIPATYLYPWGTAFTPPKITQQPVGTSAVEGGSATFTVKIDPLSPASAQWQKNGANISGATSLTLNYAPVALTDNQARFRVVLSNQLGTATSDEVVLSVTPDTTKPTLASALNLGSTSIRLTFSEPVDQTSKLLASSYKVSGGVNVSSVVAGDDASTVVINCSPLTFGTQYTITVSNVKDRAATPNTILANSTLTFTAVEYAPVAVGSGIIGSTVPVNGGFDVSGSGTKIGGTSDEFQFGYQEKSGDFDIKARVEALSITDPWVEAGLVARESLDPAARFAGIFSSSAQLGCYFESRSTAGAASQTAAPAGGFPANYPQMYLRIKRSGSVFSGYASFDGTNWQQLGSVTLALGTKVYLGMGVSSHTTNVATAKFRDIGNVVSPGSFTYSPTKEWIGPSTRRTGLVFSEIMYHPPLRSDTNDLEFVEIYNAEAVFIDLSGWRIGGGINYVFPQGSRIQAGQFIVVAADPGAMSRVYGITNAFGPYSGRLSNGGDELELLNASGAVRLELDYDTKAPWPVSADGAGHSLVLSRPSFGENDARAWSASSRIGGSPGELDAVWPNPWQGVMINEFLAHTDDPQLDFIELYNASNNSVDISGSFITDSLTTNKFQVPAGTILPARGFASFDQNQLGFSLSADGETIYLFSPDKTVALDAVQFEGQENGVSSGRSPDGAPEIRRLSGVTPGAANAAWKVEEVVINELMYSPITGNDSDQYVELYNSSNHAIDISHWSFERGISFNFPAGAMIPPFGYVVVAKDAEHLRASYSQLNTNNTFGNFSGKLSGSGEAVALAKYDTTMSTNEFGVLVTNKIHIVISTVDYRSGGRWAELADGGGSSLELVDPRADTLRASSWQASNEQAKGQWASFEYTGKLDLGDSSYPANRLQVTMLGAGECLVDQIEVLNPGGPNLMSNGNFESGSAGWNFFGHHKASTIESGGAFEGLNLLHVRAPGDGDTANNSIRGDMTRTLASGETVTIRAKVRWLQGWPEILFRIRGGWLEMPVRMNVPSNLGTPGLPNSRLQFNAGPAIYDVRHTPVLPQANQPIVITCRISDPDGVASPRVRWHLDGNATLNTASLRDDGTGGDVLAGDGVYTATITGKGAGTLIAFRVEASDDASPSVSTVFPVDAPTHECLVRWGDPIPFGTFAHYHLWDTAATESAFSSVPGLDNRYWDATLVYGNGRVIYNAGFRNKGSPYHGGTGDYAVTVPKDDLLLGIDDRVFASTGNGGNEGTAMKGDVSGWIGEKLGIPFLHSHYMRLFRNGNQYRANEAGGVLYDLEQPNRFTAKSWFGGGGVKDDLYKIAVWFEFGDDNGGFSANGASLQRFLSGGAYKLARYRYNWQIRPDGPTASDYSSLFNIVTAANSTSGRITQLPSLANMEEWMRVFAFHRVLGNWDSYGFSVGQNMYMYTPLGQRAVLMPWDVDFVLGDGNGPSDALYGGQDPILNTLFDQPIYRRALYRAFQDAINGPMQPQNYQAQIDARKTALANNGATGVADPGGIRSYLDARRSFLQTQIQSSDVASLAITSNGGADFTSSAATVTLTGTAPYAVATIEINGVPYPVTWTGFTTWSLVAPLGGPTNVLQVVGKDLRGNAVPGASDTVTVTYTGPVPQPQDWVVINEIMYNPVQPNADYVELYNRHSSYSFDLSGFQLSGVDYQFPNGTFIPANGYLVIAEDPAAFGAAFGATIPVLGPYSGNLQNNGETLRLIKPGTTAAEDLVIDDVRYSNDLPWPVNADGFGPSLQLIDSSQDNWRPGNWGATDTNNLSMATPGRANVTRNVVDAYPALWINEVLPQNTSGQADNFGEHDPWIELYNSGASTIDLSTVYLSDDPANLIKWQFPAGAQLGAGQFAVIWADNQPSQSNSISYHANFKLNPTNGVVLLSRVQLGIPAAMDYLNYELTSADLAYGSYPDGEPRKRRTLYFPTPGAANNPVIPSAQVFVNEWMASNASALLDPADNQYEDWFELYNAGTNTVDLSGFYLTDSTAKKTQYQIPPGYTISPGAFRIVWADGEPTQNAPGRDLHVNFSLKNDGEEIALYTPDQQLVDSVTFGAQAANVSQGRFPDGAVEPFLSFAVSTPGGPNLSASANQPPSIAAIADQTVNEGQLLSLHISATDPDAGQTLTYELLSPPAGAVINAQSGNLTWTPTEAQGPAIVSLTVRVTDNGTPARTAAKTFKVTVNEVNLAPSIATIPDVSVNEGSLLSFVVAVTDSDLPSQAITFALGANAPAGASIEPSTGEFSWVPAESQGPGSYMITVVASDNGTPSLSATNSFHVTVQDVNNPPVITQLSGQSVDEGSLLQVGIQAVDPDLPAVTLTYSITSGPSGATIDAATGVFKWTPGEADGPHDYNVTVKVSEPGGTPSSTMSFVIGVREVNTKPTLTSLPVLIAQAGQLLVITNHASDPDLPVQSLSYSASTPLPTGATIDQASGIFRWQLSDDPPVGTNRITIRVTDDSQPALFDEKVLTIIVQAPYRVAINEIMQRPAAANAEYIELANYSAVNSIDISGWRVEGYDYQIPMGTVLQPGGFICIARNTTAFATTYGAGVPVLGNATISIGANGGKVRLLRPRGGGLGDELIDSVNFSLNAPWPSAALSSGASLQLIDAMQDHDRASNWGASIGNVTNAPANMFGIANTWRYFQDSAGPTATWNLPGFDDSGWPQGKALLYVEEAALPAAKNTALTLGAPSYFFRTHFNFNGVTNGAMMVLNTVIDDGAIFYLNGVEVYRLRMPEGAVTPGTFATSPAVGDAAYEGPFTIPAAGLKIGDNVLAVEVHQISATSSDIVFGATLDLITVSPAGFTPGAVNSIATNLPAYPLVWLNEVMPVNTAGAKDNQGHFAPWVELYNSSAAAVSLDGWFLSDSYSALNKWSFPTGTTIPARGFLVVWADGQVGESTTAAPHTSFGLSGTNGVIALSRLQNGSAFLVDYLNYGVGGANLSYGLAQDGNPDSRQALAVSTPGNLNTSGVPDAVIAAAVVTQGQVRLSWASVSGHQYRVQACNDLRQAVWQEIYNAAGDGTTQSFSDPFAAQNGAKVRFYRLLVE